MTCELDFPHTPLWCQPCWDGEQRGKQITALNSLTKQIQELGEMVLDMNGVSAPPRPAPRPAPPPPPPSEPPVTGSQEDDYQWKT